MEPVSPLQELIGELVVIDTVSPYVYLGKLAEHRADFLLLEEVDVHDLRDVSTTREKYVLDTRIHGIRANRRRVWLSLREVVGISRLDEVMEY
jgi:hypothetical protein